MLTGELRNQIDREMDPYRTDVRIISARRPTRSEVRQYREEEMP